jgi:chemotaxis protein methyltransferase WspC
MAADLDDGTKLANAGRLQDARVHVERTIRRHGPSANALYLLGLLHDAAGNRAEAAAHYRKALYLNPHHQEALMHLAALMDRQDGAEAGRLRARARRAEREVRS